MVAVDELNQLAIFIVQVPGMSGLELTGLHTPGHLPPLQARVAEVAFLNDALFLLKLTHPVGADQHAELAADAAVGIDDDDTVRPPLAGPGGAAVNAGGILAVHAGPGQVVGGQVGEFPLRPGQIGRASCRERV